MNPYVDTHISENEWLRSFNTNLDNSELIWHRDRKDRTIFVMSGDNWRFQRENELPELLVPGKIFNVEKMVYHRLIMGTNNLILKIKERDFL